MKKYLGLILTMASVFLTARFAFAIEEGDSSWIAQALDFVKSLFEKGNEGKLVATLTSAILLIISSMKVSFIKPLWDKLGDKKEWLAPILGLLSGAIGLFAEGEFSWTVLLAAIAGGALSPYIHDLLDQVKKIPGIGQAWLSVIEIIKKVLFAPKETTP